MPATVRLGFIGAGWWATADHMPLLAARGDVETAAGCRLGREELAAVRERFGFPFATEDYRELLDQPLDGVVISSPHRFHDEHAKLYDALSVRFGGGAPAPQLHARAPPQIGRLTRRER